jgi:putative DNA primase/helicase
MSERIDTDALQREVNIVDIIGNYVPLKKHGAEYYGKCPFHDDHKDSLQVNPTKQIYSCFACNDANGKVGGDVLDFLQRWGFKFHDAVKVLKGESATMTGERKQNLAKITSAPQWKQIPAPGPALEISHYKHGKPAKAWAYRGKDGKIIGYVCRFNFPDGSKDVLPFVYATDGTKKEWRWLGFDDPRPLYNLDQLVKRPDAMVMIVEGEKTADAAQKLFPSVVVVCWIGGAKAISKTDWSPLFGRKLLIWPDNDKTQKYGEKHEKAGQVKPWAEQPGNWAMLEIENILREKCPSISWVRNDDSLPDKWDIADATEWTAETASAYVKKHIYRPSQSGYPDGTAATVKTPEKKPEPPKSQAPATSAQNPEPPQAPAPPKPAAKAVDLGLPDQPFKFLGFDKTESGGMRFHFYVKPTRTVVSLASSSLSKTNLMTIAPLNWWENNFPGKTGVNLDGAQQFIVHYGSRRPYSDKHVRGRGAWMEGYNVVLHAGENLIVNGKLKPIGAHESKYIYEVGEEMGFSTDNPLNNIEAHKLMDVLNLINWERPINPYLLAGWTVIAPICGALKWRPHVWVTGGAGVGKTWLFREIIKQLLGSSSLRVQSETTEAGIRQILGHDARPVVFDEAEGGERKDNERIQTILNLMRSASAEDGGIMAKGSAGGVAKTYHIRSCFAFASIAVGVHHQSDRSRVSIIGLVADEDKARGAERWKRLQAKHVEVITEEYCERLRARTIKLLPTIVENARVFSAAVAAELGEQRAGDQLGTLLAGAYSLVSDNVITYEEACIWVKSKDWSEERQNETYRDENRLLQMLMETTVSLDAAGSRFDRTIGELVEIAAGRKPTTFAHPELIEPDRADDRLRRFGMKVDGDYLYISNTADQIRQRLRETAWSKNHGKILKRIKTAEHTDSTRFGPAVITRAVRIKLSEVLGSPPSAHSGGSPNGSNPAADGPKDDLPF